MTKAIPAAALDEFRSSGVLGILYAEDFGEEPAPPAEPEPEPAPAPPPITEADVAEACRGAVAAAEAEWAQGAAERRTLAFQALAAGLAAARQDAVRQAEEAADALARAVLSTVAGVLPHMCRAHGDAEVAALVRELLPLLAPRGRVVVRAHPGVLPALGGDLQRLPESVAENVELRPANLPPGDARLSWEGGSLDRDAAAICAAVTESLAGLGLLPSGTPQRSHALAE